MGSWRTDFLNLRRVSLVTEGVRYREFVLQSMAKSQIAKSSALLLIDPKSVCELTAIYGIDRGANDKQSPQRYELMDPIET